MEASAMSFIDSLRNIFRVMRRKESAMDYDILLRKIFESTPHVDEFINPAIMTGSKKLFDMSMTQKIISAIIDARKTTPQLSVIPIVGVCGSGKTALARLVYDDDAVMKEHFKLRAWVKVEGQELRLHQVAQGILKSLLDISCSIDDMDELDEIVRETLQSERCLIVFDGVESMSDDSWLHMVKRWFDFADLGSVVLITSCRKQVTNLVWNHRPFELSQLSEDAALSLYRHLAYSFSEEDVTTPLMAKNVAALCGGDSLSLRLFGSCMRNHSILRELISTVDFSVVMLLPAPDASAVILMCVWALPQQLRQCLALCSVFPKGYALNKQKVIRMLIAHLDCCNQLSDFDDSCVDQLISMSFFTDVTYDEYGEIEEFQMPDLIRKIAKDVARVVLKLKLGVIGSIGEDAEALSFTGEYNPQQLQTMILSPSIFLGGDLDHWLAEFLNLHSLDLSCSGIRMLSEDICELEELRYLNLSNTLIEMLPDSITRLSELRTLDLSWCSHLKALPAGLRYLTQMTHLDLYRCESLSHLPSGIGFLENLTSMPLLVLGNKDHHCASLGDLRGLNKLRGRLEIRNLENVRLISDAANAELRHKNLDHLGLSWTSSSSSSSRSKADEYDCFKVLEWLEPNERLRVLELTGYMGTRFPLWISFMHNLTKISISDCGFKELPAALGKLRSLEELQLRQMRFIERIDADFYGDCDVFPSLKQLGLHDLPRLFKWSNDVKLPISSHLFPRLETLTVEGCPRLESLPSIPNTLRHLTVCNSSSKILNPLTRFDFRSSVLIKDMELGMPLKHLTSLYWVQKLILYNIKNETTIDNSVARLEKFPFLKHLGILHCHQLKSINLVISSSLGKLHISDCPILTLISLERLSFPPRLGELVVEDCPQATEVNELSSCRSLRKLIIKSCSEFEIGYELVDLAMLEYLFISGCPKIEKLLQMDTSLISHIPCVILGNRKIVTLTDGTFSDSK
ncbi:hypothetical protein ABFX02_07G098400 [Erythranthe guttata]